MQYENILQSISEREELEEILPEGAFTSPLIIGSVDGKAADCFFTLAEQDDGVYGPFYQVRAFGNDIVINKCELKPERLADKDLFSVNDEVEEHNPGGAYKSVPKEKTVQQSEEQYMELYSVIREYAFAESVTEAQKDSLMKFALVQTRALDPEMNTIAMKLFPEFYDWLASLQICKEQN